MGKRLKSDYNLDTGMDLLLVVQGYCSAGARKGLESFGSLKSSFGSQKEVEREYPHNQFSFSSRSTCPVPVILMVGVQEGLVFGSCGNGVDIWFSWMNWGSRLDLLADPDLPFASFLQYL
ncbi:hypothetical protein Acr_10g0009080 [Actinidia rufa]|uniref:Uncharacterized protein n=1 Tax=Actinidia rufa TaxID=165716 RepID=A0A7J0FA92_9ERIC|nr:hypothetical protein Acr_10g0009080 [Actinidia rufa]